MATALAKTETQDIAIRAPWEDKLELVKNLIGAKDIPNDQFELFLYQARRAGLDPLAKQIYALPFTKNVGSRDQPEWVTQLTIVTGIDGYRLMAERSGLYAGQDDAEYGPETEVEVKLTYRSGANKGKVYDSFTIKRPEWAKVTVYKIVAKTRCPFTATARWDEYFPADRPGKWRDMPFLMLSKCAEALAIRKAFPTDTTGLYVEEEMQRARSLDIDPESVIDVAAEPAAADIAAPAPQTSAAATALASAAKARAPHVPVETVDGSPKQANAETGEVVEPAEEQSELEGQDLAHAAHQEMHESNPMGGYWLIHNKLGLPKHEGALKVLNHEVWGLIMGSVRESWGDAPKEVWEKLRHFMGRLLWSELIRSGQAEKMPEDPRNPAVLLKKVSMPGPWAQWLSAEKAKADADPGEYDPFLDTA